MDTKKEYIVPYRHKDCICLESEHLNNLTSKADIYILGKKRFVNFYHHKTYDADLVEYFQSNKMLQMEDTDTNAHDWYNKWYYNETNVNDYIPIVKHYERCSGMKDKFMESFATFKKSESFEYYNELFIDNLYGIERNGLKVNYEKFVEKFQTNNLIGATAYTEYNIYTSTGRPSNKHGGVNYAAINKEDGSRESFISRHEYGMLIEFDYDSAILKITDFSIVGTDLDNYEYTIDFYDTSIEGTDSLRTRTKFTMYYWPLIAADSKYFTDEKRNIFNIQLETLQNHNR